MTRRAVTLLVQSNATGALLVMAHPGRSPRPPRDRVALLSCAAFLLVHVYHDDVRDYSTNEPTMDGTASAIQMLSVCGPVIP